MLCHSSAIFIVRYSNFIEILSTKNVDLIQNVAYYVYYSFKLKNCCCMECFFFFNEITVIICNVLHTNIICF